MCASLPFFGFSEKEDQIDTDRLNRQYIYIVSLLGKSVNLS